MPFIQFQFRRGTGAEWSAANTVLAPGEMGIDTDTYRFKIGDGTTAWNNLTYSPVADGPQGALQYNDGNAIAGSSNLVYTDGQTLSIAGDILPQANVTYSLGNANLRWANLYLAGNTIDLGGSQIKSDTDGAIVLVPPVTISNPNPTALVINTTGSIVPVETVDGVPNANAVANAVSDTDSTFGNVFVLGNLTANQSTVKIGNISITGDTISSVDGTITIDPAASGSTGNLIIEGNLQVKGNVTYIDSQTITVNDLMINMANNANTSSQASGGGIGVGPVGSEYATLTFDNGNTAWRSNINMSVTGNVTASGSITATGNVSGGNVSGALITGTLATAAQPNITSVGNLSSLTISGNVTGNLLPSANVTYDLGSATQAWRSLYISGNTLYIADESMAVNSASGIWSFTSNGGEITLGAESVFANSISANYVLGNGSLLTGIVTAAGNVNYANSAGTAATVTTNAQPNITSVGNLTSLTVTGNVSANYVLGNGSQLTGLPEQYGNANVAAYLPTYTGNVSAGNVSVTGNISANYVLGNGSQLTGLPEQYGNANVAAYLPTYTGNVAANNVTITGVFSGNGSALTALPAANISGTVANANYANTAGTAATVTTNSQPNITAVGTLTSLTVSGAFAAGNITASGVLTVSGTGQSSLAGNLNMGNRNIVGLAEPVNSTDAATKQYVDAIAEGLHIHAPCAAATPANLAEITGGTITYDNGTSGVGATLTVSGGTYGNIDGVNIAVTNTRILVKSEANAAHNGIYVYSNATVLTRSLDFDTPTEMAGGDFTFVQQGTLYNDTGWVCTDPVITVGTSAVNFVQFSGAGTYTAGTGLTLNGSQFSISNTAVTASSYGGTDAVATFTVNAQGQLTAASNTAIAANAANLSGTTLAATIVNSSLTSVGNLTALTVTGNISGNFITAAEEVLANRFEGNGYQLTSINAANISGTVANANYALYSNTVLASSQPNITSVGNLTSLTVSGNISGNYILGNGSQLTGLISANSFGNILVPNSNTVAAGSAGANLTLAAGNAMSITTDPANNKVTIAQINFSQDFGFITGPVDQADDLGLVTLTANQAGDLGTVTVDGYVTPATFILPTFTVATLPNPAPAAQVIYVSDEAGGAVMAFSDGTHWRRCTDRAIVT